MPERRKEHHDSVGNQSLQPASRNGSQVAEWERQLASSIEKTSQTINDISRRCQGEFLSQRPLPPPPPSAFATKRGEDVNRSSVALPCSALSHRAAAVASFHATRGAGATRPVPNSVVEEITNAVRRSVDRKIDDKLGVKERTTEIIRGQVAAISDDLSRFSRDVGSLAGKLSSHERALDALRHESNIRRDMLTKLESVSADEAIWRNAINSDLALLKQKSAQNREDIMARATSAELKMAIDSVHTAATSSVAEAISPVQNAFRNEMDAVRQEIRKVRQDHAKIKEELDAVGIAGSNRMGSQSLNDGIKTIVAHAVAIHSSEVECKLKKDLRNRMDAQMHDLREEFRLMVKHATKDWLAADAEVNDIIAGMMTKEIEGIRRDLQASTRQVVKSEMETCRNNLSILAKEEICTMFSKNKAGVESEVNLVATNEFVKFEEKIRNEISLLEKKLKKSIDGSITYSENIIEQLVSCKVEESVSAALGGVQKSEEIILSKVPNALEDGISSDKSIQACLFRLIENRINENQLFVKAERDSDISASLHACQQHALLIENVKEEFSSLRNDMEIMRCYSHECTDTIKSVTSKVDSLQARVADFAELKQKLVDFEAKLSMTYSLCDTVSTGFDIVKVLGNRIQNLEEEFKDVTRTGRSLTDRMVQVESMCESFKSGVPTITSDSNLDFAKQCESFRTEISQLRIQVESKTARKQKNFDDRNEKENSELLLVLGASNEKITKVSRELKAELNQIQRKIQSLDEASSTGHKKVSKLHGVCDELYGSFRSLKEAVTAVKNDLSSLASFGNKVQKLEKDSAVVSELAMRLSLVEEKCNDSDSVSLLEQIDSRIRGECDKIKTIVRSEGMTARSETCDSLERAQKTFESFSDRLTDEVSVLEQKLRLLNDIAADHGLQILRIQDKAKEADKSLQDVASLPFRVITLEKVVPTIETLQEDVASVQKMWRANEQIQASFDSKLSQAALSVKRCDSEMKRVQNCLDEISAHHKGNEQESSQLRSNVAAQLGTLKEDVHKLSERLKHGMIENSNASDVSWRGIKELREKVSKMESQMANTLESISQIQTCVTALPKEQAWLKIAVQDSKKLELSDEMCSTKLDQSSQRRGEGNSAVQPPQQYGCTKGAEEHKHTHNNISSNPSRFSICGEDQDRDEEIVGINIRQSSRIKESCVSTSRVVAMRGAGAMTLFDSSAASCDTSEHVFIVSTKPSDEEMSVLTDSSRRQRLKNKDDDDDDENRITSVSRESSGKGTASSNGGEATKPFKEDEPGVEVVVGTKMNHEGTESKCPSDQKKVVCSPLVPTETEMYIPLDAGTCIVAEPMRQTESISESLTKSNRVDFSPLDSNSVSEMEEIDSVDASVETNHDSSFCSEDRISEELKLVDDTQSTFANELEDASAANRAKDAQKAEGAQVRLCNQDVCLEGISHNPNNTATSQTVTVGEDKNSVDENEATAPGEQTIQLDDTEGNNIAESANSSNGNMTPEIMDEKPIFMDADSLIGDLSYFDEAETVDPSIPSVLA